MAKLSKRLSASVATTTWSVEETLMEHRIGDLPKFQMESGWSKYSLQACTRSELTTRVIYGNGAAIGSQTRVMKNSSQIPMILETPLAIELPGSMTKTERLSRSALVKHGVLSKPTTMRRKRLRYMV